MKLKLDDREAWVLTEVLSSMLDLNQFYSTDEDNNEDSYDVELRNDTADLYEKLLIVRGLQ